MSSRKYIITIHSLSAVHTLVIVTIRTLLYEHKMIYKFFDNNQQSRLATSTCQLYTMNTSKHSIPCFAMFHSKDCS